MISRMPYGTALILALFALAAPGARASQGATAEERQTIILPHVSSGFCLAIDIDLEGLEFAFKKEPVYVGDDITRAAIPLGQSPRDAMGFAYDKKAGKLYLDLNRNFDLTDDPKGVFARAPGPAETTIFNDVRFSLQRGDTLIPYVLTINLTPEVMQVIIQSGWAGEVEIWGKPYRVSFADDLDGVQDSGDDFTVTPLTTSGPPTHIMALKDSKSLFLEGMTHHFELQVAENGARLDITSSGAGMGTLIIEGQHIKRLELMGPTTVVLEKPGAEVQIPFGEYTVNNVTIGTHEEEQISPRLCDIHCQVSPDAPATLRIGAPLKAKIEVLRRGAILDIDFTVIGQGGEEYSPRCAKACRFTVYKGGKPIINKSFEYG